MQVPFQHITPLNWPDSRNVLARAERYGKQWLLKGLRPDLAQNKTCVDLLRKEFDIAMHLRHPGVVGVVGMEYVDAMQSLCIVEEWIDGTTMAKWLECPHNLQEKLHVARQLLISVGHCHRQGVVHRDLKPSNVMVTRDGEQVKIIDFGLSDTEGYNVFKGAAGTPHYVDPEVLNDGKEADFKSDIYSVGQILRDMHLPNRFSAVVEKATREKGGDRYQTIEQLLAAMDNCGKKKSRMYVTACVPLLVVAACLATFYIGYNTSGISISRDKQKPLLEVAGWVKGDSVAFARDTSLVAVTVPERDLHLFYYKAGAPIAPRVVPESEAMDLGLSVEWAPYNVGGEGCTLLRPGALFQHGYRNLFVVGNDVDCVENLILDKTVTIEGTEFDPARCLWGGRWRMPVKSEFEELITRCNWEYIDRRGIIPGYLVTGPNGRQIFFPLAGFRYFEKFFSIGEMGYYWTANREILGETGNEKGLAIVLTSTMIMHQCHSHLNAFSVRPVLDKNN